MSDAPLEGLAPVWSLGIGVAEALLQACAACEEILLAQSCRAAELLSHEGKVCLPSLLSTELARKGQQ